jgi:hypothetical protein
LLTIELAGASLNGSHDHFPGYFIQARQPDAKQGYGERKYSDHDYLDKCRQEEI